MKILYVVSRPLEINTSASIRNRATILGLVENGHTVDLFTTEPDRNHSAYDESLVPEGIKVKYVRLGGTQNLARVGRKMKLLRPIKGFVYKWMNRHEVYDNLKGIINHISDIDLRTEKYDVIISSSDPKSSHLFVERLLEKEKEFFKGRWIQIWGDPFLGDITRTDKKNLEIITKEERRLLKGADKIVYVSKLTKKEQQKLYPESKDKMSYYPIPYMNENIYQLRDLKSVPTVELAYCGDYNIEVRNILPLYKAVTAMNNVHLTICGGSNKPVESCENVTVYGRVPFETVREIEGKADVLVHLSNLSGSQIPGKIYQYSGTNKPVLFILDGEIEQVKEQFSKYERYYFAVNNELEIEKSITEISNLNCDYKPVSDFSKKKISENILD